MATFVTYPLSVSNSTSWSNASNILGNNTGNYAVLAASSATGQVLSVKSFDNLDSTLLDPKVQINSLTLTLTVSSSVTAASGDHLMVSLNLGPGGKSTVEQVLRCDQTSASTVTLVWYGFSDGTRFKRRDFRNNQNFTVKFRSAAVPTGDLGIARVQATFDYEDAGYLIGADSVFPKDIDSIPTVVNSSSRTTVSTGLVISSRQMNHLGDAIVTTQKAALGDPATLASLGVGTFYVGLNEAPEDKSPELIFLTAYLTGSVYPEFYSDAIYVLDGVTQFSITDSPTGSTISRSDLPTFPLSDSSIKFIEFNQIYGTGWISAASAFHPLYITPHYSWACSGLYNSSTDLVSGVSLMFSALPGPIAKTTTPGATVYPTDWLLGGKHQPSDFKGHFGTIEKWDLSPYDGSHDFFIKILAIGTVRNLT